MELILRRQLKLHPYKAHVLFELKLKEVNTEQELHDLTVSFWCTFTSRLIIDPYFFEQVENGKTNFDTANGQCYLNIPRDSEIPLLQEHVIESIIFKQDGAPLHIFNAVKQFLKKRL